MRDTKTTETYHSTCTSIPLVDSLPQNGQVVDLSTSISIAGALHRILISIRWWGRNAFAHVVVRSTSMEVARSLSMYRLRPTR